MYGCNRSNQRDHGGRKRMKLVQMLFPEGKSKAFTMSYDDGVIQDRRLVALMNSVGVKGTFNLNSGFLGRKERAIIDGMDTDITKIAEEEVAVLYHGHEIANHGVTHLKVTDVGTDVVAYQIIEDRKRLESLAGEVCQGFAYPFGCYSDKAIQALNACGIVYARTVENTGTFDLPQDFMKWNPTCHHNDDRLMSLVKDFCEEDGMFGSPRLFYLWGHSYEFDQRENWNIIEDLMDYIKDYKEKVWFATNIEIYRYVTAFEQLIYTVDGSKVYNPTAIDIYLSVDGDCFPIPSGKTVKLT